MKKIIFLLLLSCTSILVQAQSADRLKSYTVRVYSKFVQQEFLWIANQSCENKMGTHDEKVEALQNVYDQGLTLGIDWPNTFIDNVKEFPYQGDDFLGVMFTWGNEQYAWAMNYPSYDEQKFKPCIEFNDIKLIDVSKQIETEIHNQIMEELETEDMTPVVAPAKPPMPAPKNEVFEFVEQMPEFPGGKQALMQYIGNNVQYPELARENNIEGKAIISFEVEKDGSIQNAKILRNVGGGCGEEALRVIKTMPTWKPGLQRGKAVRVKYTIPVAFKLK